MADTLTQENKYMFFGVYLATGVVGLVGNAISFRTFWNKRRKSYFHLQLAVANALSLMSIVLSGPSALTGEWMFGKTLCSWFGFQVFLAGFVEMTFACLICIECYLATTRTQYYKALSSTTFSLISTCVWVYAVSFSVAPLLGWNTYTKERHGASCGLDLYTNDASYRSYFMTTQTVFLAFAMAAVLCLTLTLCQPREETGAFNPVLTDRELIKISATIFLVLGVCCIPYYLRVAWYLHGQPPFFTAFIGVEFSHLAMKFGCALHPFIYMMISPTFRGLCISMFMGVDIDKKRG